MSSFDYKKMKRLLARKYKQSLPYFKKTGKELKKIGQSTLKTGATIAKDVSKTKIAKQNIKTVKENVKAVKSGAGAIASNVATTASSLYKQSPVKVDVKAAKKIAKPIMKMGGSGVDQAFSIYKSHVRPELVKTGSTVGSFVGGIRKKFMGSYTKNKKGK
ncbi:MAG: hypothetical protein CBC24_09195 [Candidatus Pelagibacter sp. TMED64]|nr:MAG: hypothetical protein CBC24_09195 [Candidatus Pelagibacter sp. TMED64]|tara:strand:+ start:74 stop:553 length:480 start_codon:yes stop_codon:yes gene_type:complete